MSSLEIAVLAAYGLVLLVISVFGSHRYFMAYLYYRHKYNVPVPRRRWEELPRVTVQLPVFNEMYVVERLIAAVCELDYPRERLRSRSSTTRPTRPPASPGGRSRPVDVPAPPGAGADTDRHGEITVCNHAHQALSRM